MNVDEFRQELEAEVRNENFNSGQSPSAAFAQKITEYMREAEYLNGDFRESYFEGKHPNDRRKNLRGDGWLVTGRGGQLNRAVRRALRQRQRSHDQDVGGR